MLSAEDIAAVKVAVELCNNPKLKSKILLPKYCELDSCQTEYEIHWNKCSIHWNGIGTYCGVESCNKWEYGIHCNIHWNEIVKREATILVGSLGLVKQLQDKVIGHIVLVGMRMLYWAKYHEEIVGFSRNYTVKVLSSSFFTSGGLIDSKKAAALLMEDKTLTVVQHYILACLYCFTEHIPSLYKFFLCRSSLKQMRNMDRNAFYNALFRSEDQKMQLVYFWTYETLHKSDNLREIEHAYQFGLEIGIRTGNKVAVEYFLGRLNAAVDDTFMIRAAVKAVQYKIKGWYYPNGQWVPSDYYVDILYFLLLNMCADEREKFFQQNIDYSYYVNHAYGKSMYVVVLECFLNWPYESYFKKIMHLMWDTLPERSFANMLLVIFDKIHYDTKVFTCEGKVCNRNYYRNNCKKLLREYWCQSPEHYKWHVLSDRELMDYFNLKNVQKVFQEVLIKLSQEKDFTVEDKREFELILSNATVNEKRSIISSRDGETICLELMRREEWQMLDQFLVNCLSCGEIDNFKRKFSLTRGAQLNCFDFLRNGNSDAADFFISWGNLDEEEISILKNKIIFYCVGLEGCENVGLREKKIETLDNIINWCFT